MQRNLSAIKNYFVYKILNGFRKFIGTSVVKMKVVNCTSRSILFQLGILRHTVLQCDAKTLLGSPGLYRSLSVLSSVTQNSQSLKNKSLPKY